MRSNPPSHPASYLAGQELRAPLPVPRPWC